jgi:pyridoxal 5'-phosphate synthase pdxT subunit
LPVIGVLALQGDVREHVRALDEAGATARPVRRLSEIESVDGLVIPGGESTTLWRLATAFDLLDPVSKIIADGMPAFGSCAGLIMLADRLRDGVEGQRTFGGIDMTARRNAFGRQVDSFERDVFLRLDADSPGGAGFDGAGPGGAGPDSAAPGGAAEEEGAPFHAVFIRAPWVEQAGEEVTVLGEDNGRIIAVRQGPLLATAFHPELTPDRRIHELFVKMVKGTS